MLDSTIFAVDDSSAAAPGSGGGKASSWPEYPGEKPRKNELKKWIQTWSDLMQQSGYGPLLRGEVPYDLLKLQPRELLPVPDASEPGYAAILSKNADIAHANKVNEVELEAKMLELKGDNKLPMSTWNNQAQMDRIREDRKAEGARLKVTVKDIKAPRAAEQAPAPAGGSQLLVDLLGMGTMNMLECGLSEIENDESGYEVESTDVQGPISPNPESGTVGAAAESVTEPANLIDSPSTVESLLQSRIPPPRIAPMASPATDAWAWRCGGCRHIFCKACGKSNMYVFACTCAEEP